ncbi:MAG TPA: DnaB-like helicase C-terminal domain-containing protein [Desulfobacteraceae bacterium]|nr:DnaB-like helicase C-terminal domain-containing protein [Desulfobacteraceae bacterium]HPJ67699.1 DnaB-like helicase C-terminal domain-containing protein [Desulfobacteraceae bacterium]
MDSDNRIKEFYIKHIPGAKMEGSILKAPCPFCSHHGMERMGIIAVHLNPESFFAGYFQCSSRCIPGGFPLYFGRLMGLDPWDVPGYDPDREPYALDIAYPPRNLNTEIKRYMSMMDKETFEHFRKFGISEAVLKEMKTGYNGRYIVYPYFLEDGNCYAARCVLPAREEDFFWHGEEAFFAEEYRLFNAQEIERCEDGALFIVEGEKNLLTLKTLGYPGIAVPYASDLEALNLERIGFIKHVFLVMNNSPEADVSARSFATRLGYKARIIKWPAHLNRGYSLSHLAADKGEGFRAAFSLMIKSSKAFSPFSAPEKEHRRFFDSIEKGKAEKISGLSSGFEKMDNALNEINGINIMGGPPKAGKSCFFLQISSEMARGRTPVVYYDFENGRQRLYMRILCRLSRMPEQDILMKEQGKEDSERLEKARSDFEDMLNYFRVVTDRKLEPDIMRRQIDFLQRETRRNHAVVVIDSLHKLPFKKLSERRTGIDAWLRQMEAIRDEQNVSFLVVSELSRGEDGHYGERPDLASFKESGDIEYSADNAMILLPDWDPMDPISISERKTTLWLAASRENSPGKIADYVLEYPFWCFRER